MLKHFPPEGLDSLFVLYNKILQRRCSPEKGLESPVIPISKPGKDPMSSINYHPIALTSVLCKVLERMVNVRPLGFFEHRRTLSKLQCGGRAKRRTIDHLLYLEPTVTKVQANSEQIVFFFFDMTKAFDLTWSHGILMDIHEARIERRMFNFIQNFLKPRTFKVKVNETLSDTKAYLKEA